MDIKKEMVKVMDSCGGEDLLRYLMKDDGVINWDKLPINPIVAYSPVHLDKAIIIGLAYRHNGKFHIIHSEYEFLNHGKFNEWVEYLMEMDERYENPSQAVLDHRRAIIATEMDIDDAEICSWEEIIREVIDGNRPTRYGDKSYSSAFDSEYDMADVLFDALFGLQQFIEMIMVDDSVELEAEIEDSDDFDEEWKNEWA